MIDAFLHGLESIFAWLLEVTWPGGQPVTIAMRTNTYTGLATTAQNNTELNTSVVDNVTVTP